MRNTVLLTLTVTVKCLMG